MKRCPRCSQTYNDDALNFCLNDGELLTSFESGPPPTIFGSGPEFGDDAPPTVMLDKPRATEQGTWQPGQPPAPWQSQSPNLPNQQYVSPGFVHSRDQTLPTISLVLGVLSLVMICCYGGLWLGLPAAIVGFLGMRNADSNPTRFGGRGMAIGGMVTGIISFLAFIGWMIVIVMGGLVR